MNFFTKNSLLIKHHIKLILFFHQIFIKYFRNIHKPFNLIVNLLFNHLIYQNFYQ